MRDGRIRSGADSIKLTSSYQDCAISSGSPFLKIYVFPQMEAAVYYDGIDIAFRHHYRRYVDTGYAVSAVLYHIGASIMVFYACRERKHFWLYPLAILIHTLMDGSLALTVVNVIDISEWVFEGLVAVCSLTVFFTAYLMLYKKDKGDL